MRPLVGTPGRAVDHVGFEVRNLEAFCKELAVEGHRARRYPIARGGA